jgi:DNA replication protein DnaC
MLLQQTIESLRQLKLGGMLRALERQLETPDVQSLPFEERLGLLVDCQLSWQSDRRLQTRLRKARLLEKATIEDFDFKGNRGIERTTLLSLANCEWLRLHQNILIVGATGVGKSYLACALAHQACREGFTSEYLRCSKLFDDLAIAKADGSYSKRLLEIARKDVLVLDDFGRTPLTHNERRDLLEIIEERYDRRSLIITSQLPTDNWHDAIVDPTIADAVLDRVIHNSHKISLKGESRRKTKAKQLQLVG